MSKENQDIAKSSAQKKARIGSKIGKALLPPVQVVGGALLTIATPFVGLIGGVVGGAASLAVGKEKGAKWREKIKDVTIATGMIGTGLMKKGYDGIVSKDNQKRLLGIGQIVTGDIRSGIKNFSDAGLEVRQRAAEIKEATAIKEAKERVA